MLAVCFYSGELVYMETNWPEIIEERSQKITELEVENAELKNTIATLRQRISEF